MVVGLRRSLRGRHHSLGVERPGSREVDWWQREEGVESCCHVPRGGRREWCWGYRGSREEAGSEVHLQRRRDRRLAPWDRMLCEGTSGVGERKREREREK